MERLVYYGIKGKIEQCYNYKENFGIILTSLVYQKLPLIAAFIYSNSNTDLHLQLASLVVNKVQVKIDTQDNSRILQNSLQILM